MKKIYEIPVTILIETESTTMNDDTNGIESVMPETDSDNMNVYNLSGQCVGSKASLQHLPCGIYLVNGRKIAR